MRKYIAILSVVCLGLIFCSSGENGRPGPETPELVPTQFSELGFAEVLAQAKQDNKHVLIDFFSPT